MPNLNIAVCEDEELELARLNKLLDMSGYSINEHTYSSAEDFLRDFEADKYDLIIMDIYMQKMTGVEAVEKIREKDKDVYIAFCTTSPDHALDGYRLNVERYLEKPVEYEKLVEVLERAASRRRTIQRRCVTLGRNVGTVMLEDIVYVEQKNHTIYIHLANGEVLHKTDTLDNILNIISGDNFYRCHKSYIVNFECVADIDANLSAFIMQTGDSVAIKQREYARIRDIFHEYMFSKLRGTR